MEARTCRPDIAVGATVILDTYRSRTCYQSPIDRRRNIDQPNDATQQAGRRRQHVDCARAEHAYCDAEPETRRRSSKSAEINDRDRFKRHARLPGMGWYVCLTSDWSARRAWLGFQHSDHQQLVSRVQISCVLTAYQYAKHDIGYILSSLLVQSSVCYACKTGYTSMVLVHYAIFNHSSCLTSNGYGTEIPTHHPRRRPQIERNGAKKEESMIFHQWGDVSAQDV